MVFPPGSAFGSLLFIVTHKTKRLAYADWLGRMKDSRKEKSLLPCLKLRRKGVHFTYISEIRLRELF